MGSKTASTEYFSSKLGVLVVKQKRLLLSLLFFDIDNHFLFLVDIFA